MDFKQIKLRELNIIYELRCNWPVKQYLHIRTETDGVTHFLKFRKKWNRSYSEVSSHQDFADKLKPLFGLKQIGTDLVFDMIEGPAVRQVWWDNKGRINDLKKKLKHNSKLARDLIKICFFDGIIGSLDRHGNNVLVLNDDDLLSIDDEDLFYYGQKYWIKFSKELRELMHEEWKISKEYLENYYKETISNREEMIKLITKYESLGYWHREPFKENFIKALDNSRIIWDRLFEQLTR